MGNFLKYIVVKKIIEIIQILTLSNHTLAITNLGKSLCQSDCLFNIRNE